MNLNFKPYRFPYILTVMGAFGMVLSSSPIFGMPTVSQSFIAQANNSQPIDAFECARNARREGFDPDQAVNLCRRAESDTIECVINARREGFDPDQAVNLCKKPQWEKCPDKPS